MVINAGVCILIFVMLGTAIYQGYKKGILTIAAPLVAFIFAISTTANDTSYLNIVGKTVLNSSETMFQQLDGVFLKFILIYITTSIIITKLTKILNQNLVIGTVSKVLGAVTNGAFCIVRIWVIMLILSVFSIFIPQVEQVQSILFSSNFYKMIYFLNPLFS